MILKKYNRHTKLTFLLFREKNKIKRLNYKKFLKKYKVHDLIKFPRNDFKYLDKKKKIFTHFNIHKTVHKKEKKYLVIKIYKKGYFYKKKYEHPILDGKKFILTKCLNSKNYIEYEQLKKKDFEFSIKTIKNVNVLKKKILSRYKSSMGNLTKKEKLNLGVATTKLKILKTIKPSF
tara:strand:+ start:216 stop:743 length:528 start_codon:yes stop_codon:yes gene_type:complete